MLVINPAFKDLYFSIELYDEYLWKGRQRGFDIDTETHILREAENIKDNISKLL